MKNKKKQKEISKQSAFSLALIWRGMAMGIAEVIPGVSGGTIAFITGIYERLLNAINNVGAGFTALKNKKGIKAAWFIIDGNFLASLLAGMFLGIGIGVFVISFLLEHYSEFVWAFFFGLILASAVYVLQKIKNFDMKLWASFAAGALVAYALTSMYPMQGSTNLVMVFCSGMIAICALILPGISGSFMLLIMGMYSVILGAARNLITDANMADLTVFATFALGCLLGLFSFAKLVSRLFKTYPNYTLATLAGFMLGSIHKIWPWRNPKLLFDKASGEVIDVTDVFPDTSKFEASEMYKVALDLNVLPGNYYSEPYTIGVIGAIVVGFATVKLLATKEPTA